MFSPTLEVFEFFKFPLKWCTEISLLWSHCSVHSILIPSYLFTSNTPVSKILHLLKLALWFPNSTKPWRNNLKNNVSLLCIEEETRLKLWASFIRESLIRVSWNLIGKRIISITNLLLKGNPTGWCSRLLISISATLKHRKTLDRCSALICWSCEQLISRLFYLTSSDEETETETETNRVWRANNCRQGFSSNLQWLDLDSFACSNTFARVANFNDRITKSSLLIEPKRWT